MPPLKAICGRSAVAVGVAALVTAATSAAGTPSLRFEVFARNIPASDSIVWTGSHFIYVQNTMNRLWEAPPTGGPIKPFARMPRLVEETRCVLSPGAHGFAPGAIFCHSPNHRIYEFTKDGRHRTVFAVLPARYPPAGDGALAFDDGGRFGFQLIAATGRSGGSQPGGGALFAIDARGRVRGIATYPGPGGADEVAIGPAEFGSAAGDALLTVDAGSSGGALVAVSPSGRVRTLASFPDGPNPIVALPVLKRRTARVPAPGLYLTDDTSSYIYFASASQLARYHGDVLVGSEMKALFWIVRPQGGSFTIIPLHSNFAARSHSLEAMITLD